MKQSTPGIVYKKEIATMSCNNDKVTTETPRDVKQLRNLRYDHLHKSRLSKDGLYNLHEIAYDIPGFVWKIVTYPDLVVIFGLQELLEELDKVLLLDCDHQLLSYDTTFQLGDFYVSPLLFRHTVFKNRPTIPAMLHERKKTETHCHMMKECVARVPSLSSADAPFVTDREKAIANALHLELPNVYHVYCWNHVIRDVRFWLTKHGAPSSDIAIYLDDIRSLFHSPSKSSYESKLTTLKDKWDVTFFQYYMKEIHPDVELFARWKLEEKGIYNPYSGVTNNQSESLNMVIKDLLKWKEAPVDCIILSLYQLQSFYVNEIRRGFSGIGNCHLDLQFNSLLTDPTLVDFVPAVSPEDIVSRIRESGKDESTEPVEEKVNTITTSNQSEMPQSNMLSTLARARLLISNDSVTYDHKLHVFNVKGSASVHVVNLFPHEKCSCPSTTTCYHIVAAKLFLGIDVANDLS